MTKKVEINIDELASLIEGATDWEELFRSNLELWQTFYNNVDEFIERQLLNPKFFTIIKFLLKQEKGQISPKFRTHIIQKIKEKQQSFFWSERRDIKKILLNQELSDELRKLLEKIEKEEGEYILGYIYPNPISDTINNLIDALYEEFFDLSPEDVRKILDYINSKIISETVPMSEYLIKNYIKKILPIKQFIGEPLKNDQLIKLVKSHQIKSETTFLAIFKNLNYEQLYKLFDDSVSNFLKFLDEIDYINDTEKYKVVVNYLSELMASENCDCLLDLIISENQSPLWKRYLNTEKYNEILCGSFNTKITYLTSKQIIFLINAKYIEPATPAQKTAKSNFINQCSYLVRKGASLNSNSNFDIDEIREALYKEHPELKKPLFKGCQLFGEFFLKIKSKKRLEGKKQITEELYTRGYDIDINTAKELLKAIFLGKIKGTPILGQAIVRSIGNYILTKLGIENNGIYFYESKFSYGDFSPDKNTIGITYKIINAFIEGDVDLMKRLEIFATLPHELNHNLINYRQKHDEWDIESYEMIKEEIIMYSVSNFYATNMFKLKNEIAARINGANAMQKLVELLMPEYLEKIQEKIISLLEEEKAKQKEQEHNRSLEFLKGIETKFQLGFDTFIKFNPGILEKYPILKLEYYPNGLPKTAEDIWLSRTEKNKDLKKE